MGSVRQLSNADGTVIAYHEYDPFGNPVASYGAESAFGYTGEQEDESGLLFLRARYYDADTGRFLNQDSWAGDNYRPQTLNQYGYVGANPVNLTDPSGKCYPPVEFLRIVEEINCENLDKAIYVWNAPNAPEWGRAFAGGYIGTWTTAHVAVLAGTSVVAWQGVGAVAQWGYAYLATHQTVATAATVAGTVGGTLDDAATVVAGIQGDQQAVFEMTTLAAVDGQLPFADAYVGGRYLIKSATDACGNATQYFFRGTSRGFPGLPSLQQAHITPTSVDPVVASVFATESEQYGEGVVYIATNVDLDGVYTEYGNFRSVLEREVALDILPADFANKASIEISATDARSILRDMGIILPSRIPDIPSANYTLEFEVPRLNPDEIQEFIRRASTLKR